MLLICIPNCVIMTNYGMMWPSQVVLSGVETITLSRTQTLVNMDTPYSLLRRYVFFLISYVC